MLHRIRAGRCAAAVIALLILAGRLDAAGWQPVETHWYEMLIGGAKAGWMSAKLERDGERFRTSTESHMKVDRGPMSVEIGMTSVFIETADGRPVEVTSTQKMSTQVVNTRWVFTEDGIEQTMKLGDREKTTTLPAPEIAWLPPQAATEFARKRRAAGAESYSYHALDPQAGVTPIKTTSRRTGESTYDLGDRTIPVTTWTTVSDLMPIEATEYFSTDGVLVYQKIQTGFGEIVTRITDAEQAQDPGDGFAPELLVETFVRLDEPIGNVDRLRRASMRLRSRGGAMPELPSAAAQRAVADDDGEGVRLVVDMDDNLAATQAEIDDPAFVTPSTMVSSDDALVRKLAERATRDKSSDPAARAEAMREATNSHISRKGLQTAFASAAETARTKQGDCSEHAVLLCAMLRADGIPARVATGLVYVDQFAGAEHVFGWHMWTQALIDGKWCDLDATLPVPYHAGHVLTGTTSLADGSGTTDLAGMVVLIGNLEIEVVEKGYASGDTR